MAFSTTINLNDSTPIATTGNANIKWQADLSNPRNVSAQVRNLGGVSVQTAGTYTVTAANQGQLLSFNNASGVAVTITAAATLGAEFFCVVTNLGAGAVVLTPASGTIDGASNVSLAQNAGCLLFSDGSNFWTEKGGGSSGGTGSLVGYAVNQTGHGFGSAGAVVAVYFDETSTLWQLAEANNSNTLGMGLALVVDANNFNLAVTGKVTGLSGLTAGEYYYVSDATPGALTTTEPTGALSYSNPMFIAVSATVAILLELRPAAILGTTTIPTSTIVNVATTYAANKNETVRGDTTSGAFTVTLPAAATCTGTSNAIVKISSDRNALTVSGNGGELIAGSNTWAIQSQWDCMVVRSNGVGWDII